MYKCKCEQKRPLGVHLLAEHTWALKQKRACLGNNCFLGLIFRALEKTKEASGNDEGCLNLISQD